MLDPWTITAIIALSITLWILVKRRSWVISLLPILIFFLTVVVTNYAFPFWTIYPPLGAISMAFMLVYVGFPLVVLYGFSFLMLTKIIRQNNNRRKQAIVGFIFLVLGLLIFGIGFFHNIYQSIPTNNFNMYLKQREHIVSLIKAGTIHGKRSSFNDPEYRRETIELPEKYKGLSSNGKVDLEQTPELLKIRFTHSLGCIGGECDVLIIYSSSNNSSSKKMNEKWEIIR